MKKKDFLAHHWFSQENSLKPIKKVQENDELISIKLPKFSPRKSSMKFAENFHPVNFLNTEWLSENLTSKSYYIFSKTLKTLINDVYSQVHSKTGLTKKLKILIFEEYCNHCLQINQHPIANDHNDFWNKLYLNKVEDFVNVYCTKVAVLFSAKLRLFKAISLRDNIKVSKKDLSSPNNLFLKLFKKDSSKEFDSALLKTNQYSWYSPNIRNLNDLSEYYDFCEELSFQEILNLFEQETKLYRNKSLGVAHKNSGLLVNSLILNLLSWMNSDKKGNANAKSLNFIGCKFVGDYIQDHSRAHWLAQNNNSHFKWDDLICPFFETSSDNNDLFFKLFNEAEFYTFLTKVSSFYSKSVSKFLSICTAELKRSKLSGLLHSQESFALEELQVEKNWYERIILSLLEKPKTNSHHALLQQIYDQLESLKENGYLIVLSNTNLFVPSQRDKTNQLLQKLNLEVIIDLSDVKSKGELPQHIYTFSKKTLLEEKTKRSGCFNFRFHHTLESLQDFSYITEELNSFFEKFFKSPPAFYTNGFSENSSFEFFQTVISEGALYEPQGVQKQITHPRFFQNILKNSISLENLYEIQSLNVSNILNGEKKRSSDQLIFSANILENQMSSFTGEDLILSVGGGEEDISLSVFSPRVLKAKAFKQGLSNCYYYKIIPRHAGLKIGLISEYFKSPLAKHFSQMLVSGSYHQVKSKMLGFPMPNVLFSQNSDRSEMLDRFSEIINTNKKNHKQTLDFLNENKQLMEAFCEKSSSAFLAEIISLKKRSMIDLEQLEINTENHLDFDFSQAAVVEKVNNLQTSPIYPNNKDLFIEFHCDHSELKQCLSHTKVLRDGRNIAVALYCENEHIVSIHCSKPVASFLTFLLKQISGFPIIEILKSLQVPSATELSLLIGEHVDYSSSLEEIISISNDYIDRIFKNSLSGN